MTPTAVAARDNIQFVLETKDGWFARHNIDPGTVIISEKGPLLYVFARAVMGIIQNPNKVGGGIVKTQQ